MREIKNLDRAMISMTSGFNVANQGSTLQSRFHMFDNVVDNVCLFSRFFNAKDDKEVQQYLIAGALKSVEAMLQEMSSQTQIHQISLNDKIFLFERIGGVNFVIIANTSMKSLQFRLKQFAEQFDSLFANILLKWNGNLDVFYPVESIADTVFKNYQKSHKTK